MRIENHFATTRLDPHIDIELPSRQNIAGKSSQLLSHNPWRIDVEVARCLRASLSFSANKRLLNSCGVHSSFNLSHS